MNPVGAGTLSIEEDRRAAGPAATGSPAPAESPATGGEWRWAIELYGHASRCLGQVAVSPDWEAAFESIAFDAVRHGRLPAVSSTPSGRVEPIWHPTLNAPYVSGFRVAVRDAAGAELTCELPVAYLRDAARAASNELVQKGELKSGDLFTFLICAFPAAPRPSGEPESPSFAIEDVVEPLSLAETPLSQLLAGAVACGEPVAEDVPVFVPQRILDEAVELARAAGESETGGILVGRLHRDRSAPEIFVEITALIAAPHTLANATQVTFTAETWAAVDAALALRRRNEMKLGWFHSHPDWCRKCPEENRERCQLSRPFLSADDLLLHRVCFGRAYHVALLISDNIRTGHTWSLFGWRRGVVAARAFHILPEPRR